MLLAILPRSIVDRYPHRCPGEGCAVCAFVAGYREGAPAGPTVFVGPLQTRGLGTGARRGADVLPSRFLSKAMKRVRDLVLT